VLVWAELLVRSAMIWIIVVLAPLGYATRASAGSRQIARRTSEIGFAVIISKFGIAVAFAIGSTFIDGATNVGEPGSGAEVEADLTGMLTGTVVVLLAAFMPWMILKATPVMEAAVVNQGAERGPLRFAAAGIGLAIGAASLARLAGTGSGFWIRRILATSAVVSTPLSVADTAALFGRVPGPGGRDHVPTGAATNRPATAGPATRPVGSAGPPTWVPSSARTAAEPGTGPEPPDRRPVTVDDWRC
jgi:hypothetical protein